MRNQKRKTPPGGVPGGRMEIARDRGIKEFPIPLSLFGLFSATLKAGFPLGCDHAVCGPLTKKTPPGESPAARCGRKRRGSGFDGVAPLPVLALGGRNGQAHLLANGPGKKPAQRMRLPAGSFEQFLGSGSAQAGGCDRCTSDATEHRRSGERGGCGNQDASAVDEDPGVRCCLPRSPPASVRPVHLAPPTRLYRRSDDLAESHGRYRDPAVHPREGCGGGVEPRGEGD